MSEMKVCTKGIVCGGLPQAIENFGWKNRLLGKRHSVCKACTAVRSSNWYYENQDRQKENVRRNNQNYREIAREFVWEYLSTHPCSNPECTGGPGGGPETNPAALEFHHLGGKEAEVSRLMGRGASLGALKAEIAKCVALCASCHRILTAQERGWYKGKR